MIGTLILLGAMPLGVGWLLNWYMTIHPETFPPLFIIGAAFLIIWACVAWNMNKKLRSTGLVMLSLNAVAALCLILLGIQALAGAYWENFWGVMSQMFYMPMLYFCAVFFNWAGVFGIYLFCFLLMALASFIGCKIAEK